MQYTAQYALIYPQTSGLITAKTNVQGCCFHAWMQLSKLVYALWSVWPPCTCAQVCSWWDVAQTSMIIYNLQSRVEDVQFWWIDYACNPPGIVFWLITTLIKLMAHQSRIHLQEYAASGVGATTWRSYVHWGKCCAKVQLHWFRYCPCGITVYVNTRQ